MSRVYTDTLEPRKPTQDITLGTAGETISVGANSINVNTVKDKGGNTLWTSDGSGNLSSVNSSLKGNLVLLTTNTFTSASSSDFTTLIDSTYDVYIFKFNDINPATDGTELTFNASTDGGSNYNAVKTTTIFKSYHDPSAVETSLSYQSEWDLAQSANAQDIIKDQGNGTAECGAGELRLFAPSSTTYIKNFYATTQSYHKDNASLELFVAGYLNTTSAVNAVQFKMASGDMDGQIKMYGLL